jgi:hypothetical protein
VRLVEAGHRSEAVPIREGSRRRERLPGDVGGPGAVHGDVKADISVTAASIGGVIEVAAIRGQLDDERVELTVVRLVGACDVHLVVGVRVTVREGRLRRRGGSGDEGYPAGIDHDLVTGVAAAASQVGGVQQTLTIRRQLDYERIGAAIVGLVEARHEAAPGWERRLG